ncbi:MAG: tetratricopeptide repeat protein [Alphaproteobacteria bacterium]|nr:tetratricopeptide repeat protein [Alphaproteobacteria bacterium]
MSYELMFQKAVQLHQNGALNEAEQIYRQILETAPDNADVLNLLGLVAQAKGIHAEAANYFYKAAQNAPKHFPIFFNLAVSLGALGKYLEATEAYQKVLQLKPDCKEAYYGLGNICWQQNNTDKAAEYFQKAIEIDNEYLEAKTNLAEITDNTAQLEQIAENNVQALYYLGRRAFVTKDYAKAADYLSKADSLSEDDEIKSMLGEALLATGDKENALKLFYQANIINPHNLTALINIADLEAEVRNFKEAEKFYKKAIEVDFNNLRAHANYAEMLTKNKRLLEALEEYRAAVIISPETPELLYNLSLILKNLEEYEQALDLMFHAFYMAPEHTDWSLNLAETIILFNQKAPEKAKKISENWYEKMPENIVTQHLWSVLNGQPSKVEKEYNRLLFNTFAPTYEQTLQNIEYKVIDKIAELYTPLKGKILDLGCGTGLTADKLHTADNEFTGIDISENMLKIAELKGTYKELKQADLTEYLQTSADKYDTILAADVFCYFGDLTDIFKLCHPTELIFSVESDSSIETFEVQPNGRYKHNPLYIRELLTAAGYTQIDITETVLRKEQGIEVLGCLLRCLTLGR